VSRGRRRRRRAGIVRRPCCRSAPASRHRPREISTSEGSSAPSSRTWSRARRAARSWSAWKTSTVRGSSRGARRASSKISPRSGSSPTRSTLKVPTHPMCSLHVSRATKMPSVSSATPSTRATVRGPRSRGAASAPHAGEELVYPGICREKQRDRPMKRPPALRLRVPEGAHVTFDDAARGHVDERVDLAVGDFVLRRGDGVFAYQLACALDDHAMRIDLVVRGADLLGSSARQILLGRMLGEPRPPGVLAPPARGHARRRARRQAHPRYDGA
jgi:hypothetical protein